ncbi:hypothetical protein TNCV_3783231 [Trichonephila clavipes]|nr:hypothetical protein TNCV_3783231 [Trichonephila clavipes]
MRNARLVSITKLTKEGHAPMPAYAITLDISGQLKISLHCPYGYLLWWKQAKLIFRLKFRDVSVGSCKSYLTTCLPSQNLEAQWLSGSASRFRSQVQTLGWASPSMIREMADHTEQRLCEVSLSVGKTSAETFEMLRQTFNRDSLGKSKVYEWFSRSNLATCQLKTCYAQGVLRQEEMT